MRRGLFACAALASAILASPAIADDQVAPSSPPQTAPAPIPASPGTAQTTAEVVVTAQRLDAARDTIQPQVGASVYSFSQQTIQALPAG